MCRKRVLETQPALLREPRQPGKYRGFVFRVDMAGPETWILQEFLRLIAELLPHILADENAGMITGRFATVDYRGTGTEQVFELRVGRIEGGGPGANLFLQRILRFAQRRLRPLKLGNINQGDPALPNSGCIAREREAFEENRQTGSVGPAQHQFAPVWFTAG